MHRTTARFAKPSRSIYRYYTSIPSAPKIDRLYCNDLDDIPLERFRQRAFIPEKPIRIIQDLYSPTAESYPAQKKWFSRSPVIRPHGTPRWPGTLVPSQEYLSQFADTILPYELTLDLKNEPMPKIRDPQDEVSQVIASLLERSPDATFHRFNAPLSLFLQAYKASPRLKGLYIAQAQIADLPKQLQDDLPIPKIVKEAGKGDIYDSNIWMGTPPTYTPLHKDPNPNLFVQLASRKVVRLFTPDVGSRIFRDVQQKIGQEASSVFRGEEMMEGLERDALDEAVWSEEARLECFEANVDPGEAVFIPKGWWHSIKSKGPAVTASVNWWFR
jgi:hypothetical protein